MPESEAEIAAQPEVRKELERTAGKPSQKAANTGDKFWFATHLLLLVACAVLYVLVGTRFLPLNPQQVALAQRIVRGAALIIIVLAISSAISIYAISTVVDASTRYTLRRIKRLVVFLFVVLIGVS